MLSKEEIEKVKRGLTEELGRTITANVCGLSTNDFSESIEILESALKYIEQLEEENIDLQKSVDQIYDDYQDIGKKAFEYSDKIEQLETDKQKLIEKLEEDIKIFSNYEERKQMCKEQLFENDGKWFYAKEILNILKGENNE